MENETISLEMKELKHFGLILGLIISIFFGIILPFVFGHPHRYWPWVIAAVLFFLALLLPNVLKPVFKLWIQVGNLLAWLNTRIILGIIFFMVFTPYALFIKLFGKDSMERKFDNTLSSYRVKIQAPQPEQMKRIF